MGGNGTCLHDNENDLIEEEQLIAVIKGSKSLSERYYKEQTSVAIY